MWVKIQKLCVCLNGRKTSIPSKYRRNNFRVYKFSFFQSVKALREWTWIAQAWSIREQGPPQGCVKILSLSLVIFFCVMRLGRNAWIIFCDLHNFFFFFFSFYRIPDLYCDFFHCAIDSCIIFLVFTLTLLQYFYELFLILAHTRDRMNSAPLNCIILFNNNIC